jgi:hypothetical protein
MSGKTFAYPGTIDLDELSNKYAPGATSLQKRKNKDAFAFIIGSIYYKELLYKDDEDNPNEEIPKIRLNSKILAFIFGNAYNGYLDYLRDSNIVYLIEEYNTFGIISKARAYALNENLFIQGCEDKWRTLKSEKISTRINEAFDKYKTDAILAVENSYKYVTVYLKEGGLVIDEENAMAHLTEMLKADRAELKRGKYKKKITPEERYTLNKMKVMNFNSSISTYIVDSSGYRLHSPLVRLPKYLRKYVTYNGYKLTSLDIKNSQPFFLCVLLNKILWVSSKSLCVQKLFSEYYKKLTKLTTPQKKKSIYWKVFREDQRMELEREMSRSSINRISDMLSKFMETPINIDQKKLNIKSLKNFKDLCIAGTLYEEMGNLFKGKFFVAGHDLYGTRGDVKLQAMRLFYGNYKGGGVRKMPAVKAFFEAFPEIGNFLLFLKSVSHRDCACLLQRLESHIVLKDVALELYRNKISPVFTIHDSIIILSDRDVVTAAEKIMSDTIFEKTGLRPKIEREDWV